MMFASCSYLLLVSRVCKPVISVYMPFQLAPWALFARALPMIITSRAFSQPGMPALELVTRLGAFAQDVNESTYEALHLV